MRFTIEILTYNNYLTITNIVNSAVNQYFDREFESCGLENYSMDNVAVKFTLNR